MFNSRYRFFLVRLVHFQVVSLTLKFRFLCWNIQFLVRSSDNLHSLLRCPSPLIYSYTRSVTVFSLQAIAWPDHASAVLMKKTSRRGKAELPCPFWGWETEGSISFAGQQKHGKGEISQGRYWQQLVIGKFAGRGNFSHPSLFGPFLFLENKTVRRGKNRTEPCASFWSEFSRFEHPLLPTATAPHRRPL